MTDEGVETALPTLCCARYRKGDEGLRDLVKVAFKGSPRTGEILRSTGRGVSCSLIVSTSAIFLRDRLGKPGKTSSTGFRGRRALLGEPSGLAGR